MATASTLPFPTPANDEQYADDIVVELGGSTSNTAAVDVVSAWAQSESPSLPGWNGLGTELYLPGAVPDPSNPKVYDYENPAEGVAAAVDMMTGSAPQTTPLESQFVTDVRKGVSNPTTLISDIRMGDWDGSPDTYDADTIQSKLLGGSFSVVGSNATGQSASVSTTGFSIPGITTIPGGGLPNILKNAAGSTLSDIAGDVGLYILKGVLTLMGGAMIVYGSTLLTSSGGKSSTNQSPAALLGSMAPEAALA